MTDYTAKVRAAKRKARAACLAKDAKVQAEREAEVAAYWRGVRASLPDKFLHSQARNMRALKKALEARP